MLVRSRRRGLGDGGLRSRRQYGDGATAVLVETEAEEWNPSEEKRGCHFPGVCGERERVWKEPLTEGCGYLAPPIGDVKLLNFFKGYVIF